MIARAVGIVTIAIIFTAASPVSSQESRVGQYFWSTKDGRRALRDLIYAEPSTSAYAPFDFLDQRARFPVTDISEIKGLRWAHIRFDDSAEGWITVGILGNPQYILRGDPAVTERKRLEREGAQREAAKRLQEAASREAEEVRARLIAAQSWPERIKALVCNRKIEKGMQSAMVKLSIGQPPRIIETDVGSVRREHGLYPSGTTLSFENDRLIGWQREK